MVGNWQGINRRKKVENPCFLLFGVWVVLAIFAKKTAVFGCPTNALAPPLIALESCSMAQTDRPV